MVTEDARGGEYREALDFLYGFVDYERNGRWKYDDGHFDLGRIRLLLEKLGNPQTHGWFVHVAGTNGKGSVSAMTASALREAGLSVGLYTSPHLVTFRERIRVDSHIMTENEVVESVRHIRPAAEVVPGLTFFDVWTALAFSHFARRSVDAAAIEVGMGGRLDSTNVVTPDVSVIMPISFDHRGKLGDTIAEIAAEKAGIIKPGIPVVSASQTSEAAEIIESRARETGSELVVVGRDARWTVEDGLLSFRGKLWNIEGVSVPLAGRFQYANAATALAALETLALSGRPVTADAAKRGIERVWWPGRLQRLAGNPDVVVDGACNVAAMEVVIEHIEKSKPRESVVALVAMCRDKDIRDVLAVLGRAVSKMVCTEARNPRAMPAVELAREAPECVETVAETDPARALETAVRLAGPDGLVIATGSLYLVGELFRIYGVDEDTGAAAHDASRTSE